MSDEDIGFIADGLRESRDHPAVVIVIVGHNNAQVFVSLRPGIILKNGKQAAIAEAIAQSLDEACARSLADIVPPGSSN